MLPRCISESDPGLAAGCPQSPSGAFWLLTHHDTGALDHDNQFAGWLVALTPRWQRQLMG